MTAETMAESLQGLKDFIADCPIIDNHSHNLLKPEGLKSTSLLNCTSEAKDSALEDSRTSLAHIRARKQLTDLYDLPRDSELKTLSKKRLKLLEQDSGELIRKCFYGVRTLLIDDGFGDPGEMESYEWHSQFVKTPCKRIFRIEAVAEDILADMHEKENALPVEESQIADEQAVKNAWSKFVKAFEDAIQGAINDEEVVGFKSIVCYLSGLDVELETDEEAFQAFQEEYLPTCIEEDFEICVKSMNDFLVRRTCELITEASQPANSNSKHPKPFQFHTGLGDADMTLLTANPAHLQTLISAYPTVPIVLLHASYPYTREAGHLAAFHPNCYLDIGLVFPAISRNGQESIFRQSLELVPWRKLLWSTDGHSLPEVFYLSNRQGRDAVRKVLCDYVEQEDLTVDEAKELVRNLFFENANRIYDLGLKLEGESS